MRKYTYEKVQEMLKPIFEFMSTEFPNDYCMIIKSDSAELCHNRSEMIFLDKPLGEKLGETMKCNFDEEFAKALSEVLLKIQNNKSEVE